MNHIFTDSMSPVHTVPKSGIWIILIEKVILSFKIYQPIWVIDPSSFCHKMIVLAKFSLLYFFSFCFNFFLGFFYSFNHQFF